MRNKAFTLAELLIALVILGVIATFTIPKVLQSQQNSRYNATAKEMAAALSGAFQAYQAQNTADANTKTASLTPYLNYVALYTTGAMDELQGNAGTRACNGNPCLYMANGGALWYNTGDSFGGTSSNRYIYFYFDPDVSTTDSNANGNGKSIQFNLYFDGHLRDFKNCLAGDLTFQGGSDQSWCPGGSSPGWFSWN